MSGNLVSAHTQLVVYIRQKTEHRSASTVQTLTDVAVLAGGAMKILTMVGILVNANRTNPISIALGWMVL